MRYRSTTPSLFFTLFSSFLHSFFKFKKRCVLFRMVTRLCTSPLASDFCRLFKRFVILVLSSTLLTRCQSFLLPVNNWIQIFELYLGQIGLAISGEIAYCMTIGCKTLSLGTVFISQGSGKDVDVRLKCKETFHFNLNSKKLLQLLMATNFCLFSCPYLFTWGYLSWYFRVSMYVSVCMCAYIYYRCAFDSDN